MKLSFRDLKQQKFTIDAEPSDTIGQVKEKIFEEKGWDATSQKLIYSGKILADANTVESYKIEEKGFIVCMVSKPKAAPAPKTAVPSTPAVSSSTPAPPAAPQQPATSTTAQNPPATPTPAQTAPAVSAVPASVPAPAAAAAPASDSAGFNDPSAMLMGSRNQAVISQMESMGFAREEAEQALRAAYFNPDRAIEYLLNGIPSGIQEDQRPPPQASPQQQSGQQQRPRNDPAPPPISGGTAETPATSGTESDEPINLFDEAAARAGQGTRGAAATRGAGTGAGPTAQPGAGSPLNMDFLRNSPHFQHLRQLVQQQPAMLEPILQQVAEGNPQLAQMIGQNQEQFLQLLSEDLVGGEGGGALPPGAISVTADEAAAIDRLCALGFPRDRVIQVYFACDKNEEWAANLLFDQPDDDN